MNVLSLFDGMSCGQIALNKSDIKYDNYFASEIKNHAIDVSKYNYPNTKHIGDVTKIKSDNLPKIDLLIGGSPCQDFSRGNAVRSGLDGSKSGLFFEYLAYSFFNPSWFHEGYRNYIIFLPNQNKYFAEISKKIPFFTIAIPVLMGKCSG